MGAVSTFLITLGIGQFIATQWRVRGASLAGGSKLGGYVLSLFLLLAGAMLLPQSYVVLLWVPLAGVLALLVLLLGGSYIRPMPNPDGIFFLPDNPAHGGCSRVDIPDGESLGPGLLLFPPPSVENNGAAICVVPGAGCNKTFFNWMLVRTLLSHGYTVLAIDLPGHGDYRHRPLRYPDCLTAIPAAVKYLRVQPGIKKVGVVGISLGGAVTIKALVQETIPDFVDALVVMGTPTILNYTSSLFYREAWATLYRSPVVPLLREITVKEAHQSWKSGGYTSKHSSTGELFDLLRPQENIGQLKEIPLLLVYGHRDAIAPPEHARAMCRAAPHADFVESKKGSHVMLPLTPQISSQIATWLNNTL